MKRVMIVISILAAATVFAQEAPPASARDYFNQGSATFIKEDPGRALAIVNEGLSFHPDDEALQKLKALLEQQNEEEQQQDQQQDQQEQDQDQDQQDQQDQEQNDESEDQQDEDEQEPDQRDQNSEQQNTQEQQQRPAPEDMTEEEANMVLDSLKQLEQAQREELTRQMIERQMQNMPPVEKDW